MKFENNRKNGINLQAIGVFNFEFQLFRISFLFYHLSDADYESESMVIMILLSGFVAMVVAYGIIYHVH